MIMPTIAAKPSIPSNKLNAFIKIMVKKIVKIIPKIGFKS